MRRRAPTIRQLLTALLTLAGTLTAVLVALTVLELHNATQQTAAERERVASFRLSDQMRQSSNDLTRMVRLHVGTGEDRYRRYYGRILSIRSGTVPRPRDYDSSYWDRVLAGRESAAPPGPPVSLEELMRRANFAPAEFVALRQALRTSDGLARLEERVMAAVAPRIAAGVDATYAADVAGENAKLIDQAYNAQKGRIMAAIGRFTGLVDARTGRRTQTLQDRTERLLAIQTVVLVLLAAVAALLLAVAARMIVAPLQRLGRVTRRISHGDWTGRARPEGVHELNQLAGDFNDMADAVEGDLAARRRAELEARAAQQRLQTIADQVPGAVFHFHVAADAGLSVRFASRDASIHRHHDDAAFPSVAGAVPAEERAAWIDSLTHAARTGETWEREYRIRRPDGGVAWMRAHAAPARNADGSAELYGYVADVTRQHELESELRRARAEAEDADKAKSHFLALMSHELRTPLVAVSGTLELLELEALDDRAHGLVEIAHGSARALLDVIGDVLDFSQIEADRVELALVPVALGTLLQGLVAEHAAAAAARGTVLTAIVPEDLAPAHRADPVRLRQVLGNLVANAVRHTDHGEVELAVTPLDGERLELRVRDTGTGVSQEDQERLFSPYVRAATSRAGGTGLGLVISRRLAEAMGGTLEMESAPGAGTTMRLTLALEPCAVPVPARRRRLAGPRALPSLTRAEQDGTLVLLVEDHPVSRRVVAAQLEALGAAVETAADGAEALERLAARRYGLVLCDLELPDLDGAALVRRIRAVEAVHGAPRRPVVALTASALPEEAERCRAAGMDEVVVKPATLDRLEQVLERWLPPVARDGEPEEPGRVRVGRLDVAQLDDFAGGDDAFAARVLESFADTIHDDVGGIERAVADGELATARRLAHRLVGACRTVGARGIGDEAARIERVLRAAPGGTADLPELVRALRAAAAAVVPGAESRR